MNRKDLNKFTKVELENKLVESQEALMNYRFQKVLQQLENPFKIRETKREIARIKTILREYELDIRKVTK